MDNEPIMVYTSGTYFCMIDTDGTNGVLVDDVGVITTVVLGSIKVVDPRILAKASWMRKSATPKLP